MAINDAVPYTISIVKYKNVSIKEVFRILPVYCEDTGKEEFWDKMYILSFNEFVDFESWYVKRSVYILDVVEAYKRYMDLFTDNEKRILFR